MFSSSLVSVLVLMICGGWSFVDASILYSGELSTDIPPLKEDVMEMARLSSIVYDFYDLDGCPNATNSFSSSSLSPLPPHVKCHWYYHSHEYGTQVLVVRSVSLDYVAVVFAGTDDLRTVLCDGDILMTSFGVPRNDSTTQLLLPSEVRVHAGFAHAVFHDNLMQQIQQQVEQAMIQLHDEKQQQESFWERHFSKRDDDKAIRLFTTGHSLGAADSVLTAVALSILWNDTSTATATIPFFPSKPSSSHLPFQVDFSSINFGSPQTGNYAWRQAVHSQLPIPNPVVKQLGIWRLVLGLDLVPRLPTSAHLLLVWQHVGHTLQLRRHPNRTQCYYLHYGNSTDDDDNITNSTSDNQTSYAGVPRGWSTTPFVILPDALYSHSISRYVGFLQNKSSTSDGSVDYKYYCDDFVKVPSRHNKGNSSDDHHHHIIPDDDFWIQPPKDSPILVLSAPRSTPHLRGHLEVNVTVTVAIG